MVGFRWQHSHIASLDGIERPCLHSPALCTELSPVHYDCLDVVANVRELEV